MNDVFRTYQVPVAELGGPTEFEKAFREAMASQFEGDFEPGELEEFWIRFHFPNMPSINAALEMMLDAIFKRFLSDQPSYWSPYDYDIVKTHPEGGCYVDFWMGTAGLMSIIH